MGEIKNKKIKKPPTPREKILEVTNWMRQMEDGGKISLRTPEEAIEHFGLNVTPKDVQGWLSRRNLTSKQLYNEAIELKKKEVVNRFISLEKIRETFMNKAINMLSEVTKNEIIVDENGDKKKIPTIPDVKALQAINLFKNAIDNFTGFADLEKLEKMEQTVSDSIKAFKHKKKHDRDKLELDKIKTNIEMEKFGILKDQVAVDGKGKAKKKLEEFNDY